MATDEDGGPNADIYDPADAIAGAAKYLLEFQVQTDPSAAIFAYNHLQSYVQSVLYYAAQYAGGNFSGGLRRNVDRQFGGPAVARPHRGRARRPGVHPGGGHRHLVPSSSWASRTCGAGPGRMPSTAPAW